MEYRPVYRITTSDNINNNRSSSDLIMFLIIRTRLRLFLPCHLQSSGAFKHGVNANNRYGRRDLDWIKKNRIKKRGKKKNLEKCYYFIRSVFFDPINPASDFTLTFNILGDTQVSPRRKEVLNR